MTVLLELAGLDIRIRTLSVSTDDHPYLSAKNLVDSLLNESNVNLLKSTSIAVGTVPATEGEGEEDSWLCIRRRLGTAH